MKRIFSFIIVVIIHLHASPQNVAIGLDKMNVFYISVDNPITVVVQNYPCNKIILKSKYGEITPSSDSCHYIYRTDSCYAFFESIFVGVMLEDKVKWLDTLEYRLKRIPDPIVYIENTKCGYIDRNYLLANGKLFVRFENLDIEYYLNVLHYSIIINRNDSIIYKETDINGDKFSSGLISEIKKSKTDDKYYFFDIIIKSFDKCSWKLPGPILKIE